MCKILHSHQNQAYDFLCMTSYAAIIIISYSQYALCIVFISYN